MIGAGAVWLRVLASVALSIGGLYLGLLVSRGTGA
jgi:hypothetical protein